jgi:SAM-dependent methyltransferase
MSDMYNSGDYLKNNPHWAADEAPHKFKNLLRIVKKNLGIFEANKKINVVDIGYGSAGIALLLARSNLVSTVTGYDISHQAYEIASKACAGVENISLNVGTIENISAEPFDLAVCSDVVEHVDDYQNFLTILNKKTKFAYFNMPIEINMLSMFRPKVYQNSYDKYGHLHFFNHDYFLFILEKTGWEIIDWDYSDAFKKTFNNKKTFMIYPFRLAVGLISEKLSASLFGGYSLQVLAKSKSTI